MEYLSTSKIQQSETTQKEKVIRDVCHSTGFATNVALEGIAVGQSSDDGDGPDVDDDVEQDGRNCDRQTWRKTGQCICHLKQ